MKKQVNQNRNQNIKEKTKNIQSLTQRLMRNVVLDYFYSFINNLNMSNSIWVLYLAFKGMSLLQIGLLEGIFHATSVIFEIPSGAAADLLGRRKTILTGRLLMAISCIVMVLSGHFWQFAAGFIIQALSYNFNSGAEEALVFDSLKYIGKEEKYLKINGRINFLIEAAQGISTLVGGIIAEYSYFWCYMVCTLIALLSLLPVLLMKEPPAEASKNMRSLELESSTLKIPMSDSERKRQEESQVQVTIRSSVKTKIFILVKEHFTSSLLIVRANHRLLTIIASYSLIFTVYCVMLFYSQQFFSGMGLNKIQISFIMLLSGIFSCVGALASDWIYKVSRDWIEFLAAAFIAAALIVFGQNELFPAVLALAIASFFNATLYPVQSTKLNHMIPTKQRATLLSLNSLAFSVMMIVIFPVSGAVADIIGLSKVFLWIGIAGLMLTVLFQVLHKGKKKRDEESR